MNVVVLPLSSSSQTAAESLFPPAKSKLPVGFIAMLSGSVLGRRSVLTGRLKSERDRSRTQTASFPSTVINHRPHGLKYRALKLSVSLRTSKDWLGSFGRTRNAFVFVRIASHSPFGLSAADSKGTSKVQR